MFAGKVLGVSKGQGGLPAIAKVQLLTESGRGKVAYLRDDYLMSPIELAIHIGELEKAEKLAAKSAKIDPAEISRAMKAARIAASRANLSVRKKAFGRERRRKIAELAARHDVPVEQLDEYRRLGRDPASHSFVGYNPVSTGSWVSTQLRYYLPFLGVPESVGAPRSMPPDLLHLAQSTMLQRDVP